MEKGCHPKIYYFFLSGFCSYCCCRILYIVAPFLVTLSHTQAPTSFGMRISNIKTYPHENTLPTQDYPKLFCYSLNRFFKFIINYLVYLEIIHTISTKMGTLVHDEQVQNQSFEENIFYKTLMSLHLQSCTTPQLQKYKSTKARPHRQREKASRHQKATGYTPARTPPQSRMQAPPATPCNT